MTFCTYLSPRTQNNLIFKIVIRHQGNSIYKHVYYIRIFLILHSTAIWIILTEIQTTHICMIYKLKTHNVFLKANYQKTNTNW